MKYKMLALILALTVLSWAQTATNNPTPPASQNASSQKDAKAACPCCQKMEGKEAASCCSHKADAQSKSENSCCGGKDCSSCMKDDKTAACAKGNCCGEGKGCCAESKNGEKTTMACCNGSSCMKSQNGPDSTK